MSGGLGELRATDFLSQSREGGLAHISFAVLDFADGRAGHPGSSGKLGLSHAALEAVEAKL